MKSPFTRILVGGMYERKKLGYKTPYEGFFFYICNCVALDTGMCDLTLLK